MTALKLPKEPCPSCPYRKDTPSGVWTADHYEKLAEYDAADTMAQPWSTFLCHQQNGCVCGGWLTTHDAIELLAVRIEIAYGTLPIEALDYAKTHDVACYANGAEARDAGLADIDDPSDAACALVLKMMKQKTKIARGLGRSDE